MKRFAVVAALALAGCETLPDTPVQPVSIVSSDFCEIMKDVAPPTGKLDWSVQDTPQSIRGVRRLAAAVDRRCLNPQPKR